MAQSNITTVSDDELIKLGSRLRAGGLATQAGYTLALVGADRAPLTEILGKPMLDEAAAVSAKVIEVAQDRALAEDEAKSKTVAQNAAVRAATRWRQKAIRVGMILRRRGVAEASDLAKITSADKSLGNLRAEVEAKAALLDKHAEKAPNPKWASTLAAQGRELAGALAGTDAAQELDLKRLPEKTRGAYRAKGLLYLALKQINDAGQILHIGDPARQAQYTMNLYYRNTGGGLAKPEEAPPGTP